MKESRLTRGPRAPLEAKSLSLLGGRLVVSSGEISVAKPITVSEPFAPGLKIAVMLHGAMTCRIDERAPTEMRAPNLCMILNDVPHRREQIFEATERLRYVVVHLTPELVEEKLGAPFAGLAAKAATRAGTPPPILFFARADRPIQALAARIIGCPMHGIARDAYLIGAAFELVGLSIDHFLPTQERREASIPLQDRARIEAARDLLVAAPGEPPRLPELARAVGLNVRKLTQGFRQVFGATAHAWLQEHRLQMAYRRLASGEANVSMAAHEAGYAPAHFATIFRKRYGFPPSDLL